MSAKLSEWNKLPHLLGETVRQLACGQTKGQIALFALGETSRRVSLMVLGAGAGAAAGAWKNLGPVPIKKCGTDTSSDKVRKMVAAAQADGPVFLYVLTDTPETLAYATAGRIEWPWAWEVLYGKFENQELVTPRERVSGIPIAFGIGTFINILWRRDPVRSKALSLCGWIGSVGHATPLSIRELAAADACPELDRADVFAVPNGSGATLHHSWQIVPAGAGDQGVWEDWVELKGQVDLTRPAAARGPEGRTDVVAVNGKGRIVHLAGFPDTLSDGRKVIQWSRWRMLPWKGAVDSSGQTTIPTVAELVSAYTADGRFALFMLDTRGVLRYCEMRKRTGAEQPWISRLYGNWIEMGGAAPGEALTTFTVTTHPDGRLGVFAATAAASGEVYRLSQTSDGIWFATIKAVSKLPGVGPSLPGRVKEQL